MTDSKLARAISYIFHPVLAPLYVLLLLLNLGEFRSHSLPFSYKLALAGVVFLTTVLSPLILTWVMTRLRIITSVFMTTKEERLYPILVISLFYYLTYYLLKGIQVAAIFNYYMLGATLLAILSLAASFFRKISLHMIGIGGYTGFFLGLALNSATDFTAEILAGILLAGIIGFARLKSDSHQPAEIYSGFAMGTVVMSVLILLL